MGRLFLLFRSYEPNTAVHNRALGYFETMSKNGVKATVCYFWPSAKRDKVQKSYSGIEFLYFWEGRKQGRITKYLSYYLATKQFLDQLLPGDVVYVYNMQDLLPKLVKKDGVKIYHEVTEHPSSYRMGTRLHFVSIADYLALCRKVDGLFVISTALKDFFISNDVDEKRITVINMTVDPQRFEGLKKDASERYIAYCGMVSNNKDGVDNLIKAFSIVAGHFPDVKLYIMGTIPASEEQQGNIRLIEELGIKDKVVLTGMVSAMDMPKILKNAEVLALARPDNLQAKYGFPTKLGEYLLTENPVVITKVGDIPLFLEDGKSALLCEPGNYNEFSNKLCWALENHENARIIGMKGAEVARECFNSEIETKKLVKVLYGNQ